MIYSILAGAAFFFGGMIAIFKTPGHRLTSSVQHLAAGLVVAAVAGQLLPQEKNRSPYLFILGFTAGTAFIFALEYLSEKLQENGGQHGRNGISYLAVIAVDIFIDGWLIGLSTVLGERQGILITIALATEFFSLSMSAIPELDKLGVSRSSQIISTFGICLFPILGAFLGRLVFQGASNTVIALAVAFAMAALLYLVIEELIARAHQAGSSRIAALMFFVGFLAAIVIERLPN